MKSLNKTTDWKQFDRVFYHNAIYESYMKHKNIALKNNSQPNFNNSENDVLLVIDMQYDFLPRFNVNNDNQNTNGTFAVYEGEEIIRDVKKLILNFRGDIYATKDYHPVNHCSFDVFPPHCIWNTRGSKIVKTIYEALKSRKQKHTNVVTKVLYKGFTPNIDSYGAIKYTKSSSYNNKRFSTCNCSQFNINTCESKNHDNDWFGGSYSLVEPNVSGNNLLKNFNKSKQYTLNKNINLNVTNTNTNKNTINLNKIINQPLHKLLSINTTKANTNTTGKKIYVCGLAGDWCVLDTCLNLAALTKNTTHKIYYLLDYTRWSYVIQLGGRLTNPYEIGKKLAEAGVILVGKRIRRNYPGLPFSERPNVAEHIRRMEKGLEKRNPGIKTRK